MTTSYARRLLLWRDHRRQRRRRLRHRRAAAHDGEHRTPAAVARAELAAATPNKGGHRERGLALIDQAIAEVRAGMAFAGG